MRDTYDLGDKLVIVTTDRQSAFDRLLAAVPFKGQVLNQTSAWWMQHTAHIVQVGGAQERDLFVLKGGTEDSRMQLWLGHQCCGGVVGWH